MAGCNNEISDNGPYLSEKEIKDYKNNRELPSSFAIEISGNNYGAWLNYKYDDLYTGSQQNGELGNVYRCVYDLTGLTWVTEESRQFCNFDGLLYPLNKVHLQKMINSGQLNECQPY